MVKMESEYVTIILYFSKSQLLLVLQICLNAENIKFYEVKNV